jgi:hypothetical protein
MLMWMDVEKGRREQRRRCDEFVDGGSKCWLPRKQQAVHAKRKARAVSTCQAPQISSRTKYSTSTIFYYSTIER